MFSLWKKVRFAVGLAAAFGVFLNAPLFAQRPVAPSSNPGNAGSTTTSPTGIGNNSPWSNGTYGTNTSPNSGNSNRPIFLSGKVMFDDGTPPSTDIRIERVCGASTQLQTHVDSKGTFSFQVGNIATVDDDATDSGAINSGRSGNSFPSSASSRNRGSLNGVNSNQNSQIWNCDLRAAYPGYRSDVVPLSMRRSMDDPNVGTIVLHRLGDVGGTTISMTTSLAPKHAQKEYQKGESLLQKGKFDDAATHFAAATDAYPKYAIAWFVLGQIQQRESKGGEARKSYQSAIAADPKYVSPYDAMALIAVQDGDWADAAVFSKQAIDLNAYEFPSSFWYNAMANFNLKKTSEAEKSAKQTIKIDTAHQYPGAENLLAQIALEKHDYPEAAAHLRAYLQLVPNAKDAETLKETLQKIEQASAQPK